MEDTEKARLVRMLRVSDRLLMDILHSFENSKLFPPPLVYRGRVKKERDAEGKIERKRKLKPEYSLDHITDLVGIRFITLLRMGAADVVENIFRMTVDHDKSLKTQNFRSCKIVEFIQYSSTTSVFNSDSNIGSDLLKDKLEEIVKNFFPGSSDLPLKHVIRAQYSSVHIVIIFDVEKDGETFSIPVEIQIRSVFEEAWGEIDHMLFYEADRESDLAGKQGRLAASRHLAVLKSLLDTAAEYAGILAEGSFGLHGSQSTGIKKSLDGFGYILEVSDPITTHRGLITRFADLVRIKDGIDEDFEERVAATRGVLCILG